MRPIQHKMKHTIHDLELTALHASIISYDAGFMGYPVKRSLRMTLRSVPRYDTLSDLSPSPVNIPQCLMYRDNIRHIRGIRRINYYAYYYILELNVRFISSNFQLQPVDRGTIRYFNLPSFRRERQLDPYHRDKK